jgi:hypothetical protein
MLHPDTNPPGKLHGEIAPPEEDSAGAPLLAYLKLRRDTNPPQKLHGEIAPPEERWARRWTLPAEPMLHPDTNPPGKLHGEIAPPEERWARRWTLPAEPMLHPDTNPAEKLHGENTPLAQGAMEEPFEAQTDTNGADKVNRGINSLPKTFDQLYRHFLTINFGGTAGPAVPIGDALTDAVSEASPFLPISYIEKYAVHLEKHLPRLRKLESANRIEAAMLETVSAVVYQHRDWTEPSAPLKRFLAVVSNFYRSFLAAEKRARIHVKLSSVLPPLAMFQHEGSNGPFTITVEDVKRLTGAEVSLVSLPMTYADDPILWAALAHEVGGHDVIHADSGLLHELSRAVPGAFAGVPIPPGVSREQLNQLWSFWMDEAAADVYGILNLGPALTICQAAYFAALFAAKPEAPARLGMESGFHEDDPMKALDDHPTQILRLHLAIGVIETLSNLSPRARTAYIDFIEALARSMSTGDTVAIDGNIPLERDHSEHISLKAPLSFMQQVARNVGAFIATATLSALAGHSIQNIETWDDSDEERSTSVMTALLRGESIALLGDDAQMLAGSILALLFDPDLYGLVKAALNEGLDLSFKRDPIWGKAQRNPVLFRFPSYNDASPDPQVPLADATIDSISAAAK